MEIRLLLRCLSLNPPDVIHYLDGEHSARYLPMLLKRLPAKKPRIAVSFHQPPGIIDDLIDRRVVRHIDTLNVVSPDQAAYFRRFVDANRIKMILHALIPIFSNRKPRFLLPAGSIVLPLGIMLGIFNCCGKYAKGFHIGRMLRSKW